MTLPLSLIQTDTRLLNGLTFSILGTLFLLPQTTLVSSLLSFLAVLLVFAQRDARAAFAGLFRAADTRWIAWPFALWPIAALLIALCSPQPLLTVLPANPLRFAIALCPLTLACLARPASRWLLWSLPAAALTAALHGAYDWYVLGVPRAQGWTNNPIHFGNMSMLVAALCVLTAALAPTLRTRWRVGLLLAAAAAVLASTTSGSRSSVLALLPLLPLLLLGRKSRPHRWLVGVVLAAVLLGGALVLHSSVLQNQLRLAEASHDLARTEAEDYDTSIGARLEMWRAAWIMFERHPLTGIGPKRFEPELLHMMEQGELRPFQSRSQAHSDIMNALATGGVLGLLCYVGLIGGPLVFFARKRLDAGGHARQRLLASLGLLVVGAYFLFGLTNAGFDLQVYSTTYSLLVCAIAGLLGCAPPAGPSHPTSAPPEPPPLVEEGLSNQARRLQAGALTPESYKKYSKQSILHNGFRLFLLKKTPTFGPRPCATWAGERLKKALTQALRASATP